MKKKIIARTVIGAGLVVGSLVATGTAAWATDISDGSVNVPNTVCTKDVTVGWHIPPGPGEDPVYSDGEINCT